MAIRVGVLTISDRCSRDESVDESGPAIISQLSPDTFLVCYRGIVPDDKKTISTTLRRWADDLGCEVILTTGGTGMSARDVTPEATVDVIDRRADSVTTYLLTESVRITPFAALSRATAGIRNQTLIVNLPGSPKAALEQTKMLTPLIPHAVELLRGRAPEHPVH